MLRSLIQRFSLSLDFARRTKYENKIIDESNERIKQISYLRKIIWLFLVTCEYSYAYIFNLQIFVTLFSLNTLFYVWHKCILIVLPTSLTIHTIYLTLLFLEKRVQSLLSKNCSKNGKFYCFCRGYKNSFRCSVKEKSPDMS